MVGRTPIFVELATTFDAYVIPFLETSSPSQMINPFELVTPGPNFPFSSDIESARPIGSFSKLAQANSQLSSHHM